MEAATQTDTKTGVIEQITGVVIEASFAGHLPEIYNALETEIPASVKVAAAPRAGKPTLWLEPDGKVAYAYRRATDEVLVSIEAIAA